MAEAISISDIQLLRLPQVMQLTQLSRSAVFLYIHRGEFPKPIKIGRSARWVPDEIRTWIQERRAAR